MKIRSYFVANSSTASFIVDKSKLTKEQIDAIWDHINYAKEHKLVECFSTDLKDEWNIVENDEIIGGETTMDNFDMFKFLELIKIDLDEVEMDGQYEYNISNILRKIQEDQEKKIYEAMKNRAIEREVELPFQLFKLSLIEYLHCECPICKEELRIYPSDLAKEENLFDVEIGFVIHCRECHRFLRLLDKSDMWKWGIVEKGNERFTMDKMHLFTKELGDAVFGYKGSLD